MNYIFIGFAVLVIFFLLVCYYFARIIVYPKVYPYQEVYKAKVEDGTLDETYWEKCNKEEIWVNSDFGYQLHGYWLPVKDAVGTVIFAHGITVNLFASIKYIQPFCDQNFNVLIYDHRNHGKSGGNVSTYGQFEKYDLRAIVDWVVEKTGEVGVIGTHGESMGAAICLQHAAIDQRLSFVVSDCAYADLMEQFDYRIKEDYRISGFLILPASSVFIYLLGKFWPQEINPVEMIPAVETPIFFIHGAEDTYIPPIQAQQLYDAKVRGFRKLWFAPHAKHAFSQPEHPKVYYDKIVGFLKEINVIQ